MEAMLSKASIARGKLVSVRHIESGAMSAQTVIVAAASVADGRSEVLDSAGNVIRPELKGVQCGRRVIEMLAIDPGPQYPFFILPQAPRHNAIAQKLMPRAYT